MCLKIQALRLRLLFYKLSRYHVHGYTKICSCSKTRKISHKPITSVRAFQTTHPRNFRESVLPSPPPQNKHLNERPNNSPRNFPSFQPRASPSLLISPRSYYPYCSSATLARLLHARPRVCPLGRAILVRRDDTQYASEEEGRKLRSPGWAEMGSAPTPLQGHLENKVRVSGAHVRRT